jgi:hypothetical protein
MVTREAMTETPATFDVSGEGVYQHPVGDAFCSEGWCGMGFGYPEACECGGLIHADWGDTDTDDNYWLYKKCDVCGSDYFPAHG